MAKIIRNLNIDYSDVAASGGTRPFTIEGDPGAIFSMEVKNEDGYYYNFDTQTFAAAKKRLKQKSLSGSGRYSNTIKFPTVTDNDQYDIYLFAESHYDTRHSNVSEVRFGDGSLDINSTVGSNSNLLQKVIYQYMNTSIELVGGYQQGSDAAWITTGGSLGTTTDMEVSGLSIPAGKGSSTVSFHFLTTSSATTGVRIVRQPLPIDFYVEKQLEISDPVIMSGEDIWAEAAGRSSGATDGQTRGTTTFNGNFSGVNKIIVTSLPGGTKIGDRLTGAIVSGGASLNAHASAPSTSIITITAINPDGDNANEITLSEAVSVSNGDTVYFNAPYYYRWATNESRPNGDVRGLSTGMKESFFSAEENPDTTPAQGGNSPGTLGPYRSYTSYTVENLNADGGITETLYTTVDVSYPAIDTTGYNPDITNGVVTRQGGVITFTEPQKNEKALGMDGSGYLNFYAHGPAAINELHNIELEFSDLKVELTDSTGVSGTKPTTTTTGTVSDSTSIAVADREGTIPNVTTISGIGIDSGSSNPTITSATADGSGSWTASAAQTLESGITLTLENTSRFALISGNIKVINNNSRATSLQLKVDVTKLLSSS